MLNLNSNLKLIPGKAIALAKQQLLLEKLSQTTEKPTLKVFQLGDDSASTLYVNLKVETAGKLGINAEAVRFPEHTDTETLKKAILKQCETSEVSGVMLQSPLPGMTLGDSLKVFNMITADKDVDGLSFNSLGRLWQLKKISELETQDFFVAATPMGVIDSLCWVSLVNSGVSYEEAISQTAEANWMIREELLTRILQGKKALVVNRSNIVGKPLAAILQMANATVTIAHSYTQNLQAEIANYDFVFLATGIDNFIDVNSFRPGQVVIDIGINSTPGSAVIGDVAFPKNFKEQSDNSTIENNVFLAPVPGGVGPLTVVNLLWNVYLGHIRRQTNETA